MKDIAIYKFTRVETALERLNSALKRLETAAARPSRGASGSAGPENASRQTAKALADELSHLRAEHRALRTAAEDAAKVMDRTISFIEAKTDAEQPSDGAF